MTHSQPEPVRWFISRSIAMELDMALHFFRRVATEPDFGATHASYADRARALPPDLRQQLLDALQFSDLSLLAHLAGVLAADDYSQATLTMRELSLPAALHRAEADAQTLGLAPNSELPGPDQLVDLLVRTYVAESHAVGMRFSRGEEQIRQVQRAFALLPRILPGGDLHARYWHWLDRFYLDLYRGIQEEGAPQLAALEQRAEAALGGRSGLDMPAIDWLAPSNPLRLTPALQEKVRAGELQVLFWAEPIGLFDAWTLQAGVLVVSCADQGDLMARANKDAEDLARRTAALADGTRLLMLRRIRNFASDNTQMANTLGIARPTVSIHAKILREAGLIATEKEGRAARHAIDATAVRRLFRDLERWLELPDEEP